MESVRIVLSPILMIVFEMEVIQEGNAPDNDGGESALETLA